MVSDSVLSFDFPLVYASVKVMLSDKPSTKRLSLALTVIDAVNVLLHDTVCDLVHDIDVPAAQPQVLALDGSQHS